MMFANFSLGNACSKLLHVYALAAVLNAIALLNFY
jgi:hypothetical protein